MAKLGDLVTYTVAERERARTVRDDQSMIGSVFHAELQDFAGVVGRIEHDGEANPMASYDIAIFVPGSQNIRWVRHVGEGSGPGTFKVVR